MQLATAASAPAGAWDRLRRSELVAAGGAVVTSFLDAPAVARLRAEAFDAHKRAQTSRRDDPNDGVRGDPDRWLESAPGGPELDSLYRSEAVFDLLEGLTGLAWRRTGEAGAFSYYRLPGHHLGLHRDIDSCDLACITCVHDQAQFAGGASGALCLYPSRTGEVLSDIRATPEHGAVHIHLVPGQTLVLLGGLVPHRLLPMATGHVRIVAPLCYQVAA
jgi:hypothetical protein